MLVTAQNLSGLVLSSGLCAPELVEEYSIRVRIDEKIRRMRDFRNGTPPIVYGSDYAAEDHFENLLPVARDIVLRPGDRILSCSQDRYTMPVDYFGLVQTKGSLARLFVSATCNDGQIEPGFQGKITLELANIGNAEIHIPVGAIVAQIFLFRCTTSAKPYEGRYQNADEPTLANFKQKALV